MEGNRTAMTSMPFLWIIKNKTMEDVYEDEI